MRKPASLAAAIFGLMLLAAQAGPASAEIDTRSIIEALMPPAQRATRNLLVRARTDAAASAAAASAAAASAAASAAETAEAAATAPLAAASSSTPPLPVPVATPAPAAPIAPLAAPAAAAPSGPPPSMSLPIQFEANSSQVRPESGALLGTLVAAMLSPELKGTRFVIEGHTDARGSSAQNQKLSQERADEVRLYLVALGVHPSRLKAVGRGSSQLANTADPLAPENRRVRVVTQE